MTNPTPTTISHEWQPSPRQAEVRRIIKAAPRDSVSLIGYGGAAGGAKTNLLANLAIDISIECPGARTLVGRQDFIDLQTTTLAEFDRAIPTGLEVKRFNSAPIYRDIRLPSWPEGVYSRVYFRGLEDWQSLLSEEFGWILIDEAQETSLRAIMALITRLRHKPEPKRGIVAGFNPFPSWPVDWFMRKQLDRDTRSLFEQANVGLYFVPSKIGDNPHLPEGYAEMMAATLAADPYMKAILVDGDPEAALGGLLFFDRVTIERLEAIVSEPVERIPTTPPSDVRGMPDGEVLIWEYPVGGERYYIGADTADGKAEALDLLPEKGGSDRNAAAIYKYSDRTQVAAIYGRQEQHIFAGLLDEWGRRYSRALVAVESNRPAVVVALRDRQYPNLFYVAPTDQKVLPKMHPERGLSYGINTNSKNRDTLLSEFREAVQMRVVRPRDGELTREMRDFLAGVKPQAAPGKHDDRIFSHVHAEQARRAMQQGRAGGGSEARMRQYSANVRIG